MKLTPIGWKTVSRLAFLAAAAFLSGIILAEAAGMFLSTRNLDARFEAAKSGGARARLAGPTDSLARDLDAFLRKNPFDLPSAASAKRGDGPASQAGIELLGTFPPLGALFRVGGTTRAVLAGREIGGQTLKKVEGTRVFLADGPRTRTLDLLYRVSGGAPAIPAAPAAPSSPRRESTRTPPSREGLVSPDGGQDGVIERDLINALLMDPYQELNRVRLRPKMAEDGSPQGIEAQWLHKDSLLLSMGLKSGDVIHSVNDIPIRTTSDIVNAMNSLLNSDRFVIAFYRDGADSQVAYTVK